MTSNQVQQPLLGQNTFYAYHIENGQFGHRLWVEGMTGDVRVYRNTAFVGLAQLFGYVTTLKVGTGEIHFNAKSLATWKRNNQVGDAEIAEELKKQEHGSPILGSEQIKELRRPHTHAIPFLKTFSKRDENQIEQAVAMFEAAQQEATSQADLPAQLSKRFQERDVRFFCDRKDNSLSMIRISRLNGKKLPRTLEFIYENGEWSGWFLYNRMRQGDKKSRGGFKTAARAVGVFGPNKGRDAARKVFPLRSEKDPKKIRLDFEKEVDISRRLSPSDFIHSVHGYVGKEKIQKFVAYESWAQCDLQDACIGGSGEVKLSTQTPEWKNERAKELLDQVCRLHVELKKVHRDIKPPNILIGENERMRLIDGALAEDLDASNRKSVVFCGTSQYVAPELYKTYREYREVCNSEDCTKESLQEALIRANVAMLSPKRDIWALGLTLFALYTSGWGLPCYNRESTEIFFLAQGSQLQATIDRLIDKRSSIPDNVKPLLKRMLQVNPDLRPSAAQLLSSWNQLS